MSLPPVGGAKTTEKKRTAAKREPVVFDVRMERRPTEVRIEPAGRVALTFAESLADTLREELLADLAIAVPSRSGAEMLVELVRDTEAAAIRWALTGSNSRPVKLWASPPNLRLLRGLEAAAEAKASLDRVRGPNIDVLDNVDTRLAALVQQLDDDVLVALKASLRRRGRGSPGASVRRMSEFVRELLESWARITGENTGTSLNRGSAGGFYSALIPHIQCSIPKRITSDRGVELANLRVLKEDYYDALRAALKP